MSVEIDPALSPSAAEHVARLVAHAAVPGGIVPTGAVPPAPPGGPPPLRVVPAGSDAMRVSIEGRREHYLLPRDGGALAVALTTEARLRQRPRGSVVLVTGVSGGLGATTLASVVAACAQEEGRTAALVDLDPLPGALATMLEIDAHAGVRWGDLGDDGPLVPERLRMRLPRWRGVGVLGGDARGGPYPARAAAAVDALSRACDTVVVDVPRSGWTGPDPLADAVLTTGAMVVGVVGATPQGLAAAQSLRLARPDLRLRWVLRRGLRPAAPSWIVADALGLGERDLDEVPDLGQERQLVEALESGDGPWTGRRGHLRRCATRVLAAAQEACDARP